MSKLEVKQKKESKGKNVIIVGRELTSYEKIKRISKEVSKMSQAEKDELLELMRKHMIESQ